MRALIQIVVAALLGAFFVLGLAVEGVSGVAFFVTSLFGIGWLVREGRRGDRGRLDRDEKLLFFAFVAFVVVAALSTIIGGLHPRTLPSLERYARFLMVIPIYLLILRARPGPGLVWALFVTAAAVAGIVAAWHVATGRGDLRGVLHVRGGLHHHILFGIASATLASLSLAAMPWFSAKRRALVAVPLIAVFLALGAAVASGSRGSWAAVPAVLLLASFMPRTLFSFRLKVAAATAFVLLAAAAYGVPSTGVSARIDSAVSDVTDFFEKDRRGTSLGARFEMWRTASLIFVERPFTGVGVGGFRPRVNELVDEGRASPSIAHYDHPHSEYLAVLATRGLLGGLALVLLLLIPAGRFWRATRQEESDVQALGFAGLTVVVSFAIFGLSEAVFERAFPVSFYTVSVAVIFAAIQTSTARSRSKSFARRHPISVTLIARDEEDRIEAALMSVKEWADEIIVLDSGSTDRTLEIARRIAHRVESTDWPGFAALKQRAVDMASHDWVLSLDSDERVTEALRNEIDKELSQPKPRFLAYRTPWAVVAFGGPIDFGRGAYAPLRLFCRKNARFSKAQVHETVMADGPVGMLRGRLLHLTHRDYRHAIDKLDGYAWLKAKERAAKGARGGVAYGLFRAAFELFYCYFIRLGMLDGRRGLVMAWLQARYVFDTQAAIWTLRG